MNKRVILIVRWLAVISMPLLLGLGSIRAIIAWDYPAFEYPRIAPDRYGFSMEERLDLAHATLDYLQRPEPSHEVIFLLEDLRLPGTNEPLYLESEIGHMIDVKDVADGMTRVVWVTAVLVIAGVAFLLIRSETRLEGYRAILHGGVVTMAILLVIALFILLAWSIFFVQFHQLLFPPGTWTFSYSDSLIRLFPEQFWFDVGVLVSVGTFLEGAVVAAVGYFLTRGAAKS